MDEEPEPEEMTAEELADALASMTPEERLQAAREVLEGEQDQDQQFFSELSAAADADEAPRGQSTEQAFRDLLGGR